MWVQKSVSSSWLLLWFFSLFLVFCSFSTMCLSVDLLLLLLLILVVLPKSEINVFHQYRKTLSHYLSKYCSPSPFHLEFLLDICWISYLSHLLFTFPSLYLCPIIWVTSSSFYSLFLAVFNLLFIVYCVLNVNNCIFHFSEVLSVLFQICFSIVLSMSLSHSSSLISLSSEVARDLILLFVGLLSHSWWTVSSQCFEIWRGFICGNPRRPRLKSHPPKNNLGFASAKYPGIQEPRNTFHINFLTWRLWDKICNVHFKPWTYNKGRLQSYILRGETYPPHSCQSRQSQMSFLPVLLCWWAGCFSYSTFSWRM